MSTFAESARGWGRRLTRCRVEAIKSYRWALHFGLLRIDDPATRGTQDLSIADILMQDREGSRHEAHRPDRIPSGRNHENDNLSVTRLPADCYGTGIWASGPVIGVAKPEP
jgi:hypothetical protein